MSAYHQPVMLREALEGLAVRPDGVYVDVTFGGGGHSRAILEQLGPEGRLIAFDQDEDAQRNVIKDHRFMLIPQNFRHLYRFLRLHKALPVDGLLADLGISSHQIDTPERGFSTRHAARLDMRMQQTAELDAYTVINTYSEARLIAVFQQYGELPGTYRLAKAIVRQRKLAPIVTTDQLRALAAPFVKGKPAQYFAQLFQAIRIEVNQELDALKAFLQQSGEVMRQGGRLVVIAYHSLEDRLVKNYMKKGVFEGEALKDFYGQPQMPFTTVVGKALRPSAAEIEQNPRARSARMRIAEKR